MKNSKYIKVSVSDRMPDKNGWYDTDCGNIYFRITKQRTNWKTYEYGEGEFPEYWLEEVPDYEVEMKEVLKSVIAKLKPLLSDEELNFHKLLETADKTLPEMLNDCEKVLHTINKD